MLTKEDKSWLVKSFVTRDENRVGMDKLGESYSRIEGKLDHLMNTLDGFTGNVSDLNQENRMGAITLRRHDVQIHELATATCTAISE